MKSTTIHRQRGFSLIELMIAIVISVFLIGGLLTLVQAMKQTNGVQSGLSQLQDNERFAMDLLSDVIQAAGDYPGPTYGGQFGEFPALTVTASGQTIVFLQGQTISGVDTAAAGGDLIAVRYATSGADGIISCVGNTSTTPVTFVNIFSIDGNGNLQCQLTTLSPPPANTTLSTTTTTLVGGVTNLSILYGVETNNAATTKSVDSYLTATSVKALATASLPPVQSPPTTGWMNVRSVQLTLAFANPLFGQPSQLATVPLFRVVDVMNQVGEGL